MLRNSCTDPYLFLRYYSFSNLTDLIYLPTDQVKVALGRLLDCPAQTIRLVLDGEELVDEDQLEQVGAVAEGNLLLHLTILPSPAQLAAQQIQPDKQVACNASISSAVHIVRK